MNPESGQAGEAGASVDREGWQTGIRDTGD